MCVVLFLDNIGGGWGGGGGVGGCNSIAGVYSKSGRFCALESHQLIEKLWPRD